MSKQSIKDALIADLNASLQQQVFNEFLQDVQQTIGNPGVDRQHIMYFEHPIDDEQQAIYKMISQKDLGFVCIERENLLAVDLIDFLK